MYIHILLHTCFAFFVKMSEIPIEVNDNESNYELTPVKHVINETKTITRLSINLIINNTKTKYDLQSVEGYFAGENTKVFVLNKTLYYEVKDIMKEVNISFTQNEETPFSISHIEDKKGIPKSSGMIDSDNISPLAEDVRERHNISANEYISFLDDFKNYDIFKQHETRVKRVPLETENESKNEKPMIVYPEIVVFVDKSLFRKFKNNKSETVAYVLTMFNGVDLYFRAMKDTKIRLNIAGIVLCEDDIINGEFIVNTVNIKRFNNFMYNQPQFEFGKDYDIAILIGTDHKKLEGSLGTAFIGGACLKDTTELSVKSTALVLDKEFSGIHTTAHELAHLFGAPHDDLTTCSSTPGYIMSYNKQSKTKFFFSPCSQKVMNDFFSTQEANCLRNNPAEGRKDKQILRILPGKYMSVDQQCQKLGYQRALLIDHTVCIGIKCITETKRNRPRSYYTKQVAALEGAPCGSNKFCFKGECLNVEVDSEGTIDKKIFLPHYVPFEIKTRLVLDAKGSSLKLVGCQLNLIAILAVKYFLDSHISF